MYKLWDMLFLFWSSFCMAESWARRLSLFLACKPFPGLCACTQTGRWCTSVVAIRSLSLFTNRAATSAACILDALPASVRRLTLFTAGYALLVTVTCCNALSNLTRLESVSLWLTSSHLRHGPKCHPCHYPSGCVLKWNCCNDYLTLSCLVKNELGNPHSSLLLCCILYYTGSSSVNWLAVSCILTVTLGDTGFKCKSSTRFMCLIINHFVMYYHSYPQVNYMVTVFIRLVIAVV